MIWLEFMYFLLSILNYFEGYDLTKKLSQVALVFLSVKYCLPIWIDL